MNGRVVSHARSHGRAVHRQLVRSHNHEYGRNELFSINQRLWSLVTRTSSHPSSIPHFVKENGHASRSVATPMKRDAKA
eukprot:3902367-Pleurochrysis_carterae.AAC.1